MECPPTLLSKSFTIHLRRRMHKWHRKKARLSFIRIKRLPHSPLKRATWRGGLRTINQQMIMILVIRTESVSIAHFLRKTFCSRAIRLILITRHSTIIYLILYNEAHFFTLICKLLRKFLFTHMILNGRYFTASCWTRNTRFILIHCSFVIIWIVLRYQIAVNRERRWNACEDVKECW